MAVSNERRVRKLGFSKIMTRDLLDKTCLFFPVFLCSSFIFMATSKRFSISELDKSAIDKKLLFFPIKKLPSLAQINIWTKDGSLKTHVVPPKFGKEFKILP